MSVERLSRLQKWILKEAYVLGLRHWRGNEDRFYICSLEVHRRFYPPTAGTNVPPARSVALSRSIAALTRAGYLEQPLHGHFHSGGRDYVLSYAGVIKAKSITRAAPGPVIQQGTATVATEVPE
jgi:hypothetical protein